MIAWGVVNQLVPNMDGSLSLSDALALAGVESDNDCRDEVLKLIPICFAGATAGLIEGRKTHASTEEVGG